MLGFTTVGLATSRDVTEPRQCLNSNLVFSDLKGAANLKVQLIVQHFCMHFNFEFWRKNSNLRCMQNFKNKLYLEMTIPFVSPFIRILLLVVQFPIPKYQTMDI